MEKENYLNEAFTALNCLDEDVFEINSDGLVQAQDFVNDTEDTEEIETVIDPLAETEEDLQDSYIGDVILDCTICQSKIYKKPEEVIVDEEATLANVGEICPYCQSSDGFKVIGQVAEYCPDCEDEEKEESDIESEEEKDDKIDESLKEDMHGSFKWELKDADGNLIDSESGFNSEDEAKENAIKEIDVFNTSLRRHPDWEFNVINTSEQGTDNWTKLQNFLGENLEKDEEDYEDEKDDMDEEITTKKGIKKQSSMKEDFNKVEIETDTQKMTVESDQSGKVEVKTEPKSDIKAIEGTGEEMIAPVEPDVEAKFETEGSEEEIMEPEKEYSDIDVDEFDENEFDELGERYLRKTYENVESYKTTKGSTNGNKLKLEGIITFKSGKKAKTNFIFEAKTVTKTGKVKFEGMNKQFARGKAFTLTGRMDGNKLLSESLQYNYRCKDVDGKSKRIYGRICR